MTVEKKSHHKGGKTKTLRFSRVATPAEPNLDKHLSVFILENYGLPLYEVVKDPEWILFTTGVMPKGKSWRDYSDTAFIDCASSPFDGHVGDGHLAGCQKVAQKCQCSHRHEIKTLLQKVAMEDGKGARGVKNHMAQAVKAMNRNGSFPIDVYRWAVMAFRSIMDHEENLWRSLSSIEDERERRKRFYSLKRPWAYFSIEAIAKVVSEKYGEEKASKWLSQAKDAFAAQQKRFEAALIELENGEIREIKLSSGPIAKMIIIETDNDQIGPASRFKGFAITVIKNSTGNVQVMTNNRYHLDLTPVAAEIRRLEMDQKGIPVPDQSVLMREGTLEQLPNWHLHQGVGGAYLYNGTRTASAVEPTDLSLQTIAQVIEQCLEKRLVSLADKFPATAAKEVATA